MGMREQIVEKLNSKDKELTKIAALIGLQSTNRDEFNKAIVDIDPETGLSPFLLAAHKGYAVICLWCIPFNKQTLSQTITDKDPYYVTFNAMFLAIRSVAKRNTDMYEVIAKLIKSSTINHTINNKNYTNTNALLYTLYQAANIKDDDKHKVDKLFRLKKIALLLIDKQIKLEDKTTINGKNSKDYAQEAGFDDVAEKLPGESKTKIEKPITDETPLLSGKEKDRCCLLL